jgi:hypothetical protein
MICILFTYYYIKYIIYYHIIYIFIYLHIYKILTTSYSLPPHRCLDKQRRSAAPSSTDSWPSHRCISVLCVMCYVLCVMCYVLCVMCYVLNPLYQYYLY